MMLASKGILNFVRAAAPVLVLAAALFFCPGTAFCNDSTADLKKKLASERKKAGERRQNLKRMTEQERKLNADLAAAEKRILQLEKGIEDHQAKLLQLSAEDDDARKEYDALVAEKKKTEKAQTDTLRLLWEVNTRRLAVGSREMDDWAGTDREYVWSRELYAVLESYRQQLAGQEKQLAEVLAKRDKLAQDMRNSLASVNNEKAALLQGRIRYDRQLADVRQQRRDTEAELKEILKLAESLNLEVTRREAKDISKMKGRLPRPVKGRLRKRFNPQAATPVRGVGFSSTDSAEVRSVAAGKVVHNDILRGFGTVIILQHNADYFTLYAYMGDSPLKVGTEVNANQKLGTVGFYPDLKGPGLYFELRFKQKAINPETWFAS